MNFSRRAYRLPNRRAKAQGTLSLISSITGVALIRLERSVTKGALDELGRRNQLRIPLAAIVEQQLIAGMACGLGDKSGSVSFKMHEERAAVKVRVR